MNEDFVIRNNILIKYTGKDKIVEIPENIEIIESHCFYGNTTLEKIILSKTCKILQTEAFACCENLKEIDFKRVETIKDNCFFSCSSLKEVTLPKTLNNVGVMFCDCTNLEKIKFNTEYSTFFISKIVGIGNEKLTEVTGPGIICENGVIYNEDKTILIAYLEGKKDKYFKIPDSVTIIGEEAIYDNEHLEELELGKNVKIIKSYGISTNLKKIILNKNLETLYDYSINAEHLTHDINLNKTNIKKIYNISIYNKNTNKNKNVYMKTGTTLLKIPVENNVNYEYKDKILLDDLIIEGKTFLEASKIISKQER